MSKCVYCNTPLPEKGGPDKRRVNRIWTAHMNNCAARQAYFREKEETEKRDAWVQERMDINEKYELLARDLRTLERTGLTEDQANAIIKVIHRMIWSMK